MLSFIVLIPHFVGTSHALPQIEWNFSKQKGGTTPGDNSQEMYAISNALNNLQMQISSLQGHQYPDTSVQQSSVAMSSAPVQTTAVQTVSTPIISDQRMMGQSVNYPMQVMPVMMMPANYGYNNTAGSWLDKPLDLLRNMSLSITPIGKIIKGLQGNDRRDRLKRNVSYTKVREVYTDGSKSTKLKYEKGDPDDGYDCVNSGSVTTPCCTSGCGQSVHQLQPLNDPPAGYEESFLSGFGENPDSGEQQYEYYNVDDPISDVNDVVADVNTFLDETDQLVDAARSLSS